MKIESTDQDIRTTLSSGYYRIPRFQRPYSWERENIQEFWDDVVRDNPTDYFIGSMVVYKDGKQRFGVVDGQQRLTTITILLCVLRNTLKKKGYNDLAQGIHSLVERNNIDNKPEFIVSTESSYPYFQDKIQKFGDPELKLEPLQEEKRLEAAYQQLTNLVTDSMERVNKDKISSATKRKEAAAQMLVAIRDALLNLKMIFIKLEDEDDAYIIFETLNTRGKDLSLTDLVKNHLTKHIKIKNSASDQVKVKWKKILDTIESSSAELDTDTFIHHFWLSRFDYLPAKSLFKILKKQIGVKEAPEYLDWLLQDAGLYRGIHEVPYGKWNAQESRIARSLSALMLFRVKQPTPCVLSLVRDYRITRKIRKRHLEEALVAIENYHFLFTAVASQSSSGGISAMYAKLARRFYLSKDAQEAAAIIKELKDKLRARVPSLEQIKAAFQEIVYTDDLTRQKKLVKYVLVGLHQAATPPVPVDYDRMTIEHIAPQDLLIST